MKQAIQQLEKDFHDATIQLVSFLTWKKGVSNMNNHKSSSKTTRKSVSYKQLPTKDTEEIENEHDAKENALSEGYRLLDIKAVPRDSIKFVEKEKRSRNDKTSRNRYINLLGHRRAESLGNVGQTRRHWSPPSLFVENEIKDGIDNLTAGIEDKYRI